MAFENKHVLVVDDSPTMRQLIIYSLQQIPNLQIDEAGDGVAALKKLATQDYDLLLTDLNMPLMDGMKLIALIRNDAEYKHLPIVVVSTEGASADREKVISLGANAYLTKPIRTAPLVEMARRMLYGER